METISHDKVGQRLSEAMNAAVKKQSPILITHEDGGSCVLIPLALCKAIEESSHIPPPSENAARLGIAKGKFSIPHDIDQSNAEIETMFTGNSTS